MQINLNKECKSYDKKIKKILKLKSEKPKWFNDIQWNNVSEDKTNLAYENGMKFLEDLDNSKKNLDGKALVFLSYLFTICGVLLYNLLFKNDELSKVMFLHEFTLSLCVLILCSGYAVLFCLTAMIFLSTQRRQNRYAAPVDILTNPNNHAQYIKNDLCLGLQGAIFYNAKKQKGRASLLKALLLFSVIFPICLIAYCLTNLPILGLIFIGVISGVLLWIFFRFYP